MPKFWADDGVRGSHPKWWNDISIHEAALEIGHKHIFIEKQAQ